LLSAAGRSIGWKSKARVQRWLSRFPLGFEANYLLQRYMQRSLPLDRAKLRDIAGIAAAHLEAVRAHAEKEPANWLEIGAGTDLALPLLLYANGIDRQVTIDIRVLARRVLVNAAISGVHSLDLPLRRLPRTPIGRAEDLRSIVRDRYGIDYLAPCDARRTGLPTGSVEVIHSTNTMEHVPPADLRLMLDECRRLLAPGGLVSLYIDYRDHYSYADRHIGPYNFLQYSDAAWLQFNCSLQYQNRLRHPDYLQLAEASGFRILSDRPHPPGESDLQLLRTLEIDPRFCAYDTNDLAIQGSHLLLGRK
jgi:hypothetical protein